MAERRQVKAIMTASGQLRFYQAREDLASFERALAFRRA